MIRQTVKPAARKTWLSKPRDTSKHEVVRGGDSRVRTRQNANSENRAICGRRRDGATSLGANHYYYSKQALSSFHVPVDSQIDRYRTV